jgi:hypothetical protein
MPRTPVLVLALAAVWLTALPASAKESSNIHVALERLGTSAGAATLHSVMRDDGTNATAHLYLRASRLVPNHEYALRGDGTEIVRFTTSPAGNATLDVDLLAAHFDPRGAFASIHDGTTDVLGAWLYADPDDDPRKVVIRETTKLAPAEGSAGTATARYRLFGKNEIRLSIEVHHAAPGRYDVLVAGESVGTLRVDRRGHGSIVFASHLHRCRHARSRFDVLDFDPRSQPIELVRDGVAVFAGPMLAQIHGLEPPPPPPPPTEECEPSSTRFPLFPGAITVGVEASCDQTLDVELLFVPLGTYDVLVDGVEIGSFQVTVDGDGWISGTIHFDEHPDSGEEPLPVALQSGTVIDVVGATTSFQTALP